MRTACKTQVFSLCSGVRARVFVIGDSVMGKGFLKKVLAITGLLSIALLGNLILLLQADASNLVYGQLERSPLFEASLESAIALLEGRPPTRAQTAVNLGLNLTDSDANFETARSFSGLSGCSITEKESEKVSQALQLFLKSIIVARARSSVSLQAVNPIAKVKNFPEIPETQIVFDDFNDASFVYSMGPQIKVASLSYITSSCGPPPTTTCPTPTTIGCITPTTTAAGCPTPTTTAAGCYIPTTAVAGCPTPTTTAAGCLAPPTSYVGCTYPNATPVPTGEHIYQYPPAEIPFVDPSPSLCKPLGVGDVADGIVNLQVGLPKFTSPVDVYIGIFAPAVDPDNIYIVKFDNTLQTLSDQTLSDGLDPWKENTIGDTQESLFGEILTSELPPGTYDFCLVVMPSEDTDFSGYYFWVTSLVVSGSAVL